MSKVIVKIVTWAVVLMGCLPLHSCKQEDVLPAITMEGKDTFGCLVNGKLWIPKGGGVGNSGVGADMSLGNFLAVAGDNYNSSMRIVLNDTTSIVAKEYILDSSNRYYSDYGITNDARTAVCFYKSDHVVRGKLIISRLSGGIVSGTFEFEMYNTDCSSDTLKVTQGRFDLHITL